MNPKQKQTTIIIVIAVVAVVAAGALILLSGQTRASGIDYASIPQERTEDGAFVLGDPDAPITIVEFADYACPHCQNYKEVVDRLIREHVVTGRARFEFRTFPTAGGALTEFSGRVAECADEIKPGSFWEVHEMFYQLAMSGQYSDQMGRIVAERLDIPYSEVLECTRTADQVQVDVALGRRSQVTGTPAVMIRRADGQLTFISAGGRNNTIPTYDVLAQVIEQANT